MVEGGGETPAGWGVLSYRLAYSVRYPRRRSYDYVTLDSGQVVGDLLLSLTLAWRVEVSLVKFQGEGLPLDTQVGELLGLLPSEARGRFTVVRDVLRHF